MGTRRIDCPAARKRKHIEKMLARAEQRLKRARRVAEQWRERLRDLDRQQVAETQLSLLDAAPDAPAPAACHEKKSGAKSQQPEEVAEIFSEVR